MRLLKFSRGADARSWYESVLREARYFEHLDRSRFTVKDLAYTTFANDVFHDGEILFRGIQLGSRQVTLLFRNVRAIDAVYSERRRLRLPEVDDCCLGIAGRPARAFQANGCLDVPSRRDNRLGNEGV